MFSIFVACWWVGWVGGREGAPFLFALILFLRRDPREQEQSCGMCCRLQLCISNRIWSDRPNVLLRFAPQYAHPWITVLHEMPQCYWKIHWRSRQSSGLFFSLHGISTSCCDIWCDSHKSFSTTVFSLETGSGWFSFCNAYMHPDTPVQFKTQWRSNAMLIPTWARLN